MQRLRREALIDGSFHHHLLRDSARVAAFAEAIAKVVQPGDVVADLGSGTGVLAFFAARAGASRVYAVDQGRASIAAMRRLLERNGVANRVLWVEDDATSWVPLEPVQVAIAEVMETGLLHEPMAAVVRHIHEGWPQRPRAIVPAGASLWVEAVTLHDDFLGYWAPLPGFRGEGSGEPCTTAARYADFDFEQGPVPEGVDGTVALRATRDARVDALRLRTTSRMAPGQEFGSGPGYCTPLVLPLLEPMNVREGQELRARVLYRFAYGEDPVQYEIGPAG